jgi:integrase
MGIAMVRLRGKTYQLYRRVPTRYHSVEPRKQILLSLHTDSKSVALEKAGRIWAQMVEGWEARLAGDTTDADKRLEAAKELAALRGFRYLDAPAVAALPREELLRRIEAVPVHNGVVDRFEAEALLGGAPRSEITVSGALDLYWKLATDKTLGKSEDQLRRWKNPRIKAIKNLIAIIGDKAISDITGDDMLDFRDWWMGRIENEGLSANAANKDLVHLGDVLKTVNKMKRLNLALPLSDLSFKQGEAGKRPPFSKSWITEKLLAPNAMAGLNEEARAILLVMINTGARPSELAALTPECIKLDAEVPHISIEAVERQLKSRNAKRVIPVLGVSHEALSAFPQGFPRYRGSSASLSATINKFLRKNGLLETDKHSLYGLRHSFEDRLLAAGIDERIRRDLFGHALNRERYGDGASLAQMRDVIQPVAL